MYHKIFLNISVICAISMMITSCGSDTSVGGNLTEFKTSYATASSATPRLEADLVTGNTCTDGVSSGGTVKTENVDFTITTTSTAKGTITPLPIIITGYTVTFQPKNAGIPALTPLSGSYSTIINPSGSATIPVAITTDRQKLDLMASNPSLACSLNIYQYDVTVSFTAVEIGIDGSKTINAGLVMAMADRSGS